MDKYARWLAVGAPVEADAPVREAFTAERDHADPRELFGPVLVVDGVVALTHLTDRCIRKYAEEAIARYTNSDDFEQKPLPLLLTPSGPLRTTDGSSFAVVGSPTSKGRGRPASRRGEHGWLFQRVAPIQRVELPDWWPAELPPCGSEQEGWPMDPGGLLQTPGAVVTVSDPTPGRWASSPGGVTFYRDHTGKVWRTDELAQARAFGWPAAGMEWAEREMLRGIRQAQQPPEPKPTRTPWTLGRIAAELAAVEEQRSAAQQDHRHAYAAMLDGYRDQLLRLQREARRRERAGS